ncbi:MAG: 30S ribosomal protein S20 [Patescibacteria group bacterium]
MPIKKAAMKAMRQSAKRADKNLKIKKTIKDLVKKSQKMIDAKDQKAAEQIKSAIKLIDKSVQKKILKKNAGARKKSRLMKKLNQLGK